MKSESTFFSINLVEADDSWDNLFDDILHENVEVVIPWGADNGSVALEVECISTDIIEGAAGKA